MFKFEDTYFNAQSVTAIILEDSVTNMEVHLFEPTNEDVAPLKKERFKL